MKRLARILFLAAIAAGLALPVGLLSQAASHGTEATSRTTLETDDLLATRVSIDEDGHALQLATRVSIDEDGRSLISQPRSQMVA